MEQNAEVTIEKKMGCTWITLPDAINMDSYRSIETVIAQSGAGFEGCVVLDLGLTTNLFSSGLGLIIRVRKLVLERKGNIVLVNLSKKIRDVLETVQLNKVFSLYATDVEFEISREEFFKNQVLEKKQDFMFVSSIENAVGRIHLSGHMTVDQDLSAITNFTPDGSVRRHVFDLTGLDLIDSTGASILIKLLMNIHRASGKSIAYGVNESIAGLVDILGLNDYLHFFPDERSAMESLCAVNS